MIQIEDDDLNAARDEARIVLADWGFSPAKIQVVGAVPGMAGTTLRPVVELDGRRYLVRWQSPELSEADLRFRHAFMAHLRDAGLPVPGLLARPDGTTHAITDNGIYEVQEWLDGRQFASEDATGEAELEAAARMLGRLHQASATFQWQPYRWPEERSADGLARSYIALIQQAAQRDEGSVAVKSGLARIAEACDGRREAAASALAVEPAPPQLHIHGDYQAHNLRFGPTEVSAIYDFDAARWDTRLLELAYSLLYFTGVRWNDAFSLTPPLADDGLDILRVHRYLGAYGREAPPAEGEAALLADALALIFPIVFANGIAEDLVFPDEFETDGDEEDALSRLHWADTFWLWLDRYRETIAQAWENAG
ncbi:MAG TPA: phosphotransferase [Ktedonobacterales bacterium]|nr:phosphotransferase [Ktedonobacterales bacterium]